VAVLDELQRLKFGVFVIPYQSIKVTGGLRDHVHEYPHVPGGSPEKMGRKLYSVSVSARFDARISSPEVTRGYPDGIYPTGLNLLIADFEHQATRDLVIPGTGTFPAYCRNWSTTLETQVRSGASVELEFVEDQDAEFLSLTAVALPTAAMATMLGDLDTFSPKPPPSLFDSIRAAINGVLAYRDQALMYRGVLVSKIEALRALFVEADDTLDELKNPVNAELIDAFQRLWEAVEDLAANILGTGPLATYVAPRDMTAAEVSRAIYGDTVHVVDVLNLNAIEDPDLIRAGTRIRYLEG
jgi:hypothetical protein